jgi:hypothetical protein
MKNPKKAQNGAVAKGVQVSKKDMKAHPKDFEFLKEKKVTPKKKSGGAINYKSAGNSVGLTGSGTYSPDSKNVGKKISKLKSGGQLPLLHTKPATPNTGDAVAAASHSASKSFKPVRKNVGKRVARLKAGGNMGKCKNGC